MDCVFYVCYVFVCLVSSIGRTLNTRAEKYNLRCSRILGKIVHNEMKKKYFWTVAPVLDKNIMGFVEKWKMIPVFA